MKPDFPYSLIPSSHIGRQKLREIFGFLDLGRLTPIPLYAKRAANLRFAALLRRGRGDFENRPLSYDCQTVMNEFVLFHQEFMHIRKHKTQHCNSMFASVYRQSYI